jgi:hypothetical protein
MTSLAAPLALTKFARGDQPAPPQGDQQDQPGPPPDGGNGGPPPMGNGNERGGAHDRGGPNRPPMRSGGMAGDQNPFDRMRGYLDLVDRFSRLARDPAASGVAAVVAAGDILRPRGADAAIQFYMKALDTVKNDTVKRAIHLQLVDLYRQSGQNEKALEQLTSLMNDAPAGDPQMNPPMPK